MYHPWITRVAIWVGLLVICLSLASWGIAAGKFSSPANRHFIVRVSGPAQLRFEGSCSHEVLYLLRRSRTEATEIRGVIETQQATYEYSIPGTFIDCHIDSQSPGKAVTVELFEDSLLIDRGLSTWRVHLQFFPRHGIGIIPTPDPSHPAPILPERMAFISDREGVRRAYIQSGVGSRPRPLAPPVEHGWAWSPDGRSLAYWSGSDRQFDLYIIPIDELSPTRLTTNVVTTAANDGWVGALVWSPDGQQLAFVSNRIGSWGIDTINRDGSGLHRLVSTTAKAMLSWSPDGSTIAFSDRGYLGTVRTDGSMHLQLGPAASDQTPPSWSPDSRRITVISWQNQRPVIEVVDFRGRERTTITTGFLWAAHPVWSPDGQWIAFSAIDQAHKHGVYIIRPDGSDQQATFIAGGHPLYMLGPVAWSPDSQYLAFTASSANSEIYIARADGTSVFNLTNHPAHDFTPAWVP